MIEAYAKFAEQLRTIPDGEVPIIVPVFNLVSYAKFMVDQLGSLGIENFIICDNGSTYQPMIDYLNEISKTHRVAFLGNNLGPRVYAESEMFLRAMPEYFVITDPDLVFNNELPKSFMKKMKRIIEMYNVSKAGFAIDIENTKDKFFDPYQVKRWESNYWAVPVNTYAEKDQLYVARIDTTFCMYRRDKVLEELSLGAVSVCNTTAIRIAGRYTCEHMGWWKEQPLSKEEEDYYNQSQTWASTYNEKVRLGYYDNSK